MRGAIVLPVGLAVVLAAGAREEVIDFEQATAGADAFDLYQSRGVTLSTHPTIFETPKARSGRHALRNVGPGKDSPSRWVSIDFAEDLDVRRVVFFVGLGDAAPGEQIRIVVDGMTPLAVSPELPTIRLPSAFDQQVRPLAGAPEAVPTPLAARFELARKPGESPITVVRVTPVPPSRVILIDDLAFEAGSPRPRTPSPAPGGEARRSDMAGGCDAYTWDMSHEMLAWDVPGVALPSLADGLSPAPVPFGRRVDLSLHPLAKTTFITPPERRPAGGYAGLVTISVRADGLYRIAAGSPLWIDVLDGTQPVASAKFEGHAGCAKVHKVVAFPLKAGRGYRVQLSGSERPDVSILVTADR